MANSWKTLSDGDIVRRALAIFHNKLTFLKTINTEYDDRFAKTGAKNGGTLLIRNPNEFTVRTGAVMDVQDIAETTQSLVVATQKGVDLNYSSLEATMSIEDFEQRVLDPAMSRLAADVEYTVISNVYKDIFWLTGTPATTPASLAAILNAGARLSESLAPISDRHLLMNSAAMAATVAALATYFHKASEIERAFSEGYIGSAAGFKWWESNMIPNHTNGTRTDSTPVCNTSTGITSGTASIVTTGQTSGQTVKVGDIFTVADVYAINRETKQRYSYLQQFAIKVDLTCDGTDTFSVTPTPVTSGAKQNIEVVSAGADKAVVHVAAGGSGAASAVYAQNLAYHRDAFTWVNADLHIEEGQRMTRANIEGVSMRIWRSGDILNDKFPCRIDVLFGYKTIRPEWATRVRG
ncbi:MAG: P22 phage major capsid protein family protein [Bacillota bacterium]